VDVIEPAPRAGLRRVLAWNRPAASNRSAMSASNSGRKTIPVRRIASGPNTASCMSASSPRPRRCSTTNCTRLIPSPEYRYSRPGGACRRMRRSGSSAAKFASPDVCESSMRGVTDAHAGSRTRAAAFSRYGS
jgi:hypothetical protein